MKYKLYSNIEYPTMTEQVLYGRGIQDIEAWVNADEDDIAKPQTLAGITEAVDTVYDAVQQNQKICIIVDCDVDGFTSSAILINFLYSLYPDFVTSNLTFLQHTGKQHGLVDMREVIPIDTKLIIAPDSSSNDYEEHHYWDEQGVDIVILDHHEAPEVSTSLNVVTVNNQLCDYQNKMLSGAGIVWQFCRWFNHIKKVNGALSTDLAALGNCGDMMSYQSIETKALIDLGFSNITNQFFNQMTLDNKYTIDKYGGIGYKAIAFAVVPFINATVRSGTAEEKDMVFRGMCNPWCEDMVPNTKRGHKGEEWPRYMQAAYITAAAKRRQTKLEQESMTLLDKCIQDEHLLDNAILVCTCEPGEVEPNIRGLAANKLASKYQRPCLVLTKSKTIDDDEYFYRGSGRNYGMSEINDLKALEESTGLCEYVQGHGNAHGFGIAESNLNEFIKAMNDKLDGTVGEPVYWVDYIWSAADAEPNKLLQLANMACYWGQDIPASQVVIKNIDTSQCQMRLCGQKNNTLRMVLPNGLVLVKFGIDEEEFNRMCAENTYMTCIVSPSRNEWQGKVSGEGMIDDYDVETKWIL